MILLFWTEGLFSMFLRSIGFSAYATANGVLGAMAWSLYAPRKQMIFISTFIIRMVLKVFAGTDLAAQCLFT